MRLRITTKINCRFVVTGGGGGGSSSSRACFLPRRKQHRCFHELLPYPPGRIALCKTLEDELVPLFHKARIDRVAFLRHGNCALARDGNNEDRPLSKLGRQQATQAGTSYCRTLIPFYSVTMHAPPRRAQETAKIILETSMSDELHWSPTGGYGRAMEEKEELLRFSTLLHRPLRYHMHGNEKERRRLAEYALDIAEIIYDSVTEEHANEDPLDVRDETTTLLFVGDAIDVPTAALGIASLTKTMNGADCILSTITKEVEGYLIDLSDQEVTTLNRSFEIKYADHVVD